MKYLEFITNKSGRGIMIISAIFLLSTMVLTVANVLARVFGRVIAGTYELTVVLIVVVAATALGYAALQKSHVVVDVITARFPKRVQGIINSCTSALALILWGVITWQSISILIQRWSDEDTELLHVPYYPFRILWIVGLVFLCLVLVKNIIEEFHAEEKR